jgi:hypothetical protein
MTADHGIGFSLVILTIRRTMTPIHQAVHAQRAVRWWTGCFEVGCCGRVMGWSLGGGRVVPSRKTIEPTVCECGVGGGGSGAGVGVGVGGVGWVIVVPKRGGGGFDTDESTRSARLGASSTRGTPIGGRPSRSSTVLGMDTCEFQRLSMPGCDGAAEHQQRHPRPVGQLDAIEGVLDVRGGDVVVVAAPVVPRQQEHGVIPVPGGGDRLDVGQIWLWPNVTSAFGCSSYGASCHTIDSAGRFAASPPIRSWRTIFGAPLSRV